MSEREPAMEQGSTGLGEGGPRPRERKGAASPIYSVELEVFEGPLDLLLHLVRKHELDILDIPISFVAEKYLEYLDVMRQLDLEIAGDYLVMAATLAYLKSRELLPPEPRSGEAGQSEEEEGEDPREALIRRLVEYERFKQAAAELDSLPVSGRDVFARGAELVMPPIDPGLAPVSLFNLAEAYYRVLTRAKVKSTHDVQIEAVTVAQRIKQLALILDEKPQFEFEELFLNRTWNSERELRAMLVVTLMSILEMVKLGVAGVQQPLDSTTIRIYRRASAQETQQALADYDEDASFGAPKPNEGESPGPSAPKRPSEAELDAVEEAALLAEALASVQEPEEPVVGYSDEGEDVAANDPASEYDDEPRPAPRRSRSESRAARADVLEDRYEAFDDEPDGRLVIVEGTSAEVPREHEGPRWGRRSGETGEEDEAESSADELAPSEDVLDGLREPREDAGVAGAGDDTAGAGDVREDGSARVQAFSPAVEAGAPERRVDGDGSSRVDEQPGAAVADAAPSTEDVRQDASRADDVDGLAEASDDLEAAQTEVVASDAGDAVEVLAALAHEADDDRVGDEAAEQAASADAGAALPSAEVGDEAAEEAAEDVLGDSASSDGSEASASLAVTGDANAFEDRPAAEGLEVFEPASESASSATERGLEESRAAVGFPVTEPTRSAEERAPEASWTAEGRAAPEPTRSAEERAFEDDSAADGLEVTEPTVSAVGEAAEVVVEDGGTEAAASTLAAGDETEDFLEAGAADGVAPSAAAEDATAEDVVDDGSTAGEAETTESTLAAGDETEDVLEAGSAGAVAPAAAAEDATAEDVPGDSSMANRIEAALGDEVVEDVLGDSLAAGGLAASTAAGGHGAADDGSGEGLVAADSGAESARATEADSGAAAEPDDVLADSQASGANEGEPAASDVEAPDSEDDESKPVRSDSDEDEAGGLFLNTGEGLGARELGDVDEDEGDAQ